jgi:hypothetical protein
MKPWVATCNPGLHLEVSDLGHKDDDFFEDGALYVASELVLP